MANKRTYYPPKTFDDDLVSLVGLYRKKQWSFSGVDLQALELDSTAQREQRVAHDSLESEYQRVHQQFGEAQEDRYERFAAALNAARGAFRNDKATSKELDAFKRSVRKAKKRAQK